VSTKGPVQRSAFASVVPAPVAGLASVELLLLRLDRLAGGRPVHAAAVAAALRAVSALSPTTSAMSTKGATVWTAQ
jgi:hypothetical protein